MLFVVLTLIFSKQEISTNKNDFNLSVSRYVDTYEGVFIRLEDLASTKDEIDAKMEELTKKIDMMMEVLDINL